VTETTPDPGHGHHHHHTAPGEMISVEAHLAGILDRIRPLPPTQLAIPEAEGCVLAEDITASRPLPPFDNSAMDGYAVRSADLRGADRHSPVELPVTEDIPAGRTDLVSLEPGTAHRIMTGAPVPAGADTVVQIELTDGGRTTVRLYRQIEPGMHVRRAGEDVTAGSVVLEAGTELGPFQLGLAAAVGAAELPVRRRPRVLVLSTGSELVEPGTPLLPGQIYESNSVLLSGAIRAAGGVAEVLRFVPDDVAAFHAAVGDRLADADLLITSGGVSAGAYEVVKDALSGQGVEFVTVAMQPGGPQGAGRYQGVPVITLPGNPVSTAVSFEVFVRPALRRALGHRLAERPKVTARLAERLHAPAGRRQYRRGHYDPVSGVVSVVGGPGSHLLASLAAADCLLVVPEDTVELRAGAEVDVLLLDSLLV
jgi:molybdopterin molybdotransferase